MLPYAGSNVISPVSARSLVMSKPVSFSVPVNESNSMVLPSNVNVAFLSLISCSKIFYAKEEATVLPIFAGDSTTTMPHSFIISFFAAADSSAPETIAPA